MSGHKRATISLNEFDLNRLENIETKLRQVEKDYESIHDRSRKNQEHELNQNLNDLADQQVNLNENLQNSFSSLNNEFQSEIQLLDEKNTNEIINQTQILHDRILELENNSWDKSLELISAYQAEIDQQSNNYINEILSRIDIVEQNILAREQGKENYAYEFIKSAQQLFSNLSESLIVERYFPGFLNNISSQIELGVKDIQHHMVEAGLSIIQQTIMKLLDIQQEITKRETSRKSLLSLANRRIMEIIESAKINRFISAVDLDGNYLDIEIDVAFWSRSIYEKTLRRALAYQHQLAKNGENYSFEELTNLVSEKFLALEKNFSDSIYQSRRNVLASQVRFNIAGSVIQALNEQGFQLNGGRYVESDQRDSYQALLKHIDGSEVVVQVSELDGEVGASQIDLETLNPHLYTQHELRQRAKELAVSLSAYGLHIGKASSSLPVAKSIKYNQKSNEFYPPKIIKEEQITYGRT